MQRMRILLLANVRANTERQQTTGPHIMEDAPNWKIGKHMYYRLVCYSIRSVLNLSISLSLSFSSTLSLTLSGSLLVCRSNSTTFFSSLSTDCDQLFSVAYLSLSWCSVNPHSNVRKKNQNCSCFKIILDGECFEFAYFLRSIGTFCVYERTDELRC